MSKFTPAQLAEIRDIARQERIDALREANLKALRREADQAFSILRENR